MRLTSIICALIVTLPAVGFSWSSPEHQAIATAAMNMVPPATQAKIKAILKTESPEKAATWLDDVREGKIKASQFDTDFTGNANWHFVDFPIGSTAYSFSNKIASPNDVVQALESAITVLEGKPSKMSKIEALRVVFHLAGDIHQPLHCGCGFYEISDPNHPVLLKAKEIKPTSVSDRGGNQLYYTKSEELHAMWDSTLPNLVGKGAALVSIISVPNFQSQFTTSGDYHHWPEKWAGDSMKQCTAAYAGIQFQSAAYVPDPRHPGKTMLKIMINLPGGTPQYKANQKGRTKTQLTKSAVHLAQLLSSIKFN